MLKSVEGIFRDGRIELLEPAPQSEESRVIITFFPTGKGVLLKDRGIDAVQAADLRGRLKTFSAEWSAPEMDVYDET
jgi:hypothetical protein